MNHAVTRGTFADIKTVKTRSVAQVIIEVPIEHINEVLHALGGYPQPGKEPWVAIARLTEQAAPSGSGHTPLPDRTGKEKRNWRDLSPVQQAGMLSNGQEFAAYAAAKGHQGDPADYLRAFCGIQSRKELEWNTTAQARLKLLVTGYMDFKERGAA